MEIWKLGIDDWVNPEHVASIRFFDSAGEGGAKGTARVFMVAGPNFDVTEPEQVQKLHDFLQRQITFALTK